MNKQQNSPLAKSKPGSAGPEPPVPQASPGPPGPLSQTPPMQRPVEPQEGPHKVSLFLFLSSHTDLGVGGAVRVHIHAHAQSQGAQTSGLAGRDRHTSVSLSYLFLGSRSPFRWIVGTQRLDLPLPPCPGPSSQVGACHRAGGPPSLVSPRRAWWHTGSH